MLRHVLQFLLETCAAIVAHFYDKFFHQIKGCYRMHRQGQHGNGVYLHNHSYRQGLVVVLFWIYSSINQWIAVNSYHLSIDERG